MRQDLNELNKLIGQKFGKLTVLEILPTKLFKEKRRPLFRTMVLCKCDCGTYRDFILKNLKNGITKSCGCLRPQWMKDKFITHGETVGKQSLLYKVWLNMKKRCFDIKNKSYKYYGERGITVCGEWLDSTNFIEWAKSNGYDRSLQLDRIDTNGNYEPSNCRFVDKQTNARNTRSNRYIIYRNERKLLCEWALITGLDEKCIRERLKRGWTVEETIEIPNIKGKKKKYLKQVVIALLFVIPSLAYCQDKKWYSITPNDRVIIGLQIIAGSADALHEVVDNHPHTFERVAGWNSHYWLPKYSWHNKEHMWTPISDGYHLTASLNRTFNYASIAISTGDLFSYQKKDRWKVIAKKFILSYLANRIGFAAVYNGVFSDRIERQRAGLDGR